MLNSSGNPIHKILILITTSAIAVGIYLLFSNLKTENINNPSPDQEQSLYTPATTTTSDDSSPSQNTNTPSAAAVNSSAPAPSPTNSAPPQNNDYFDAAKSSERDQKHFQEITRKTNIQIRKQMRQEEITSLKESIENDKALLKKIEESGSGIEDYKYIEQNLKKRIQRLRQLSITQ